MKDVAWLVSAFRIGSDRCLLLSAGGVVLSDWPYVSHHSGRCTSQSGSPFSSSLAAVSPSIDPIPPGQVCAF